MTNDLSNDAATAEDVEVKKVVQKNYDLRSRIAAVGVVPALFIASVIVAVPAVVFVGTNVDIVAALIITAVAELLVIGWALWYTGVWKDWPEKLYLKNFKWKYLLIGAAAGQVFYWGLQGIAAIAAAAGSPVASSDTAMSLGSLKGLEGYIVLLLVAPVIVPFIEELLFRGVIVSSLQRSKWNATWISVVVSAVSFGVMHIQGFSSVTDYTIFLWITLMGGIFAYLYLKTKSLWTVFAAHCIYNMTSSVLMLTGIAN